MSNATLLEPEESLHPRGAKNLSAIRAMLMLLQGGGAFPSSPHKASCSICRSHAERPAESMVLIVISHTYGSPAPTGYSTLVMKTSNTPPRARRRQQKPQHPCSDAYWSLPPSRTGRRRQHKEAPGANITDGDQVSTDYHEILRKRHTEMWKDLRA